MSIHRYEKLDPAKKEFRLVQLHSRNRTGGWPATGSLGYNPVECTLYTTSMLSKPVYQALSYTWGRAVDILPIKINHEDVLITRNLRSALEHVREECEDVTLWIDAICINQKDSHEKTIQVGWMDDIYTNAQQTIAWLGPATEYSHRLLTELTLLGGHLLERNVYRMIMEMANAKDIQRQTTLEHAIKESMTDYIENYYQHGKHFEFIMFELAHLLGHDYWSRVWIIQEFVLSKKLQIRCGKGTILFEHLHAAFLFLLFARNVFGFRMSELLANREDPWQHIPETVFSHNALETQNTGPVLSLRRTSLYFEEDPLLRRTRFNLAALITSVQVNGAAHATEDRDRIYALLGLASDKNSLNIKPDYDETVSCETVYTAAARAMLTAGHVDLLAFSQLWIDRGERRPVERARDLPSWVPDWRVKVLNPRGGKVWDTPFAASGTLNFQLPADLNVSEHQIKLLGYRIDVLDQVADEFWTEGPRTRHYIMYRKFLSDIHKLCDLSDAKTTQTRNEIYHNPTDRKNARILVPLAGQQVNTIGFTALATLLTAAQEGHDHVQSDIHIQRCRQPRHRGLQVRENYYLGMNAQRCRRPFISKRGFVGLVPRHSLPGDVVVIFLGGKFPYVIRHHEDGAYTLIGEAYVHGIMYGEYANTKPMVEEFTLK